MKIAEQLGKVVDKTSRLIDLCEALQDENKLLRQESESLKNTISDTERQNKQLAEQLRVLTLARSLEGMPAKELGLNEKSLDIKQKIAEFVGEIDKCIVLLKK